jgi:hypothetical protein
VVAVPTLPRRPVARPDHAEPAVNRGSGAGIAWLVADRARGDFLCQWYGGSADDSLLEQARAATAQAAVSWGRSRTPRVRIRTATGRTYWAGSGPKPDGITDGWVDEIEVAEVRGVSS